MLPLLLIGPRVSCDAGVLLFLACFKKFLLTSLNNSYLPYFVVLKKSSFDDSVFHGAYLIRRRHSMTAYTTINATILGIKIIGRDHGIPLNVISASGHKNGVGKNARECVTISMRMCSPHPPIAQYGLRRTNHTKPKTAAKITKLCVTLYSWCTYAGIIDGSGGPADQSGLSPTPRVATTVKIPKENKSGSTPKKKANQKAFFVLRPNAAPPHNP